MSKRQDTLLRWAKHLKLNQKSYRSFQIQQGLQKGNPRDDGHHICVWDISWRVQWWRIVFNATIKLLHEQPHRLNMYRTLKHFDIMSSVALGRLRAVRGPKKKKLSFALDPKRPLSTTEFFPSPSSTIIASDEPLKIAIYVGHYLTEQTTKPCPLGCKWISSSFANAPTSIFVDKNFDLAYPSYGARYMVVQREPSSPRLPGTAQKSSECWTTPGTAHGRYDSSSP